MKTFDSVEMKRRAQEIIHKQLEGLTLEEKLKYWQEREKVLRKRIEEAKKRFQPA